MRLFARAAAIIAALAAFYSFANHHIHKLYIFDPATLQRISRDAIAQHPDNMTQLLDTLVLSLRNEYGPHVSSIRGDEWFVNNAGGAMGSMTILHASLSEYLIIFGSPVGTEGHTGWHFAEDFFTILRGEQWASSPGELERKIYRPGDQNFHCRYKVGQYRLLEDTWALELAQGWIPTMMAFGLWDIFTSTLDLETLWRTCYFTGRHMLFSALKGKF